MMQQATNITRTAALYNRALENPIIYRCLAVYIPAMFCGFLVLIKLGLVAQAIPSLHDSMVRLEAADNLMSAIFLGIFLVIIAIRRPAKTRVTSGWGIVAAFAGSFSLIAIAFAPLTTSSSWLIQISIALVLIGSIWTIASILVLGKCFGILPEVRGLVTRGPYRLVRHPIYVGETVAGLGLLLPSLSAWTILIFCVYMALQTWRTHYEEAALVTTFPEYQEYASRTARFLPGLM